MTTEKLIRKLERKIEDAEAALAWSSFGGDRFTEGRLNAFREMLAEAKKES